ncbi:hypothetical protein VTN00DRAFT_7596 [Thermoascus crustaceus]|uniref:uncharacterized protein n=1 Tax=Thermoascus crustaceus TaxID=5088 RepID=UPI0037426901
MTIGIKPDPSFFKVKYKDVAPKVGLVPYRLGNDIPTFQMYRAWLQDDLSWDILQELRGVTAQYGTPDFHPNEEATSRYISAYFNKIISLFSGILLNTPYVLLESETTQPGQIKYQYTVGGAITVLFIEVPYKMGHVREQLDCFGQHVP